MYLHIAVTVCVYEYITESFLVRLYCFFCMPSSFLDGLYFKLHTTTAYYTYTGGATDGSGKLIHIVLSDRHSADSVSQMTINIDTINIDN